ncbi:MULTISPECIES: hypothetical protein [Deinococcus]|uniref:Uncharacterized protein n=2 Tax=Deinococcus TaxID=1298 RepID=A0A221T3L3_9DEIO|nr:MULTISPECIES: hypothetical protein [Deinococcus]ASN83441.1 hypothetical protein DFI_19785 [Deinococcus ficus]MDP9766515.1 hypothetical protein [Deinococcus enclensis]
MKHVIVVAALLGCSAQAARFLGKPITDTTAPLCGRTQCTLLSSRVEYREFGTVRIRTFQMRGTDVKLTYTSDSTGVIREGTMWAGAAGRRSTGRQSGHADATWR